MLLSHMETKGQRWPNVRLGEIGDVSTAYNYGLPDMMMNNLWPVYDFNILQEPQNDHIYGFPEQGSSEFTVSDAALSSPRFLLDMEQSRENDMEQSKENVMEQNRENDLEQNRENDDPNSIKDAINQTEMVDFKVTQKSVKGLRSKRCKRTVFEGPWSFVSTPSMDVYESTDNQGSAMSKRTLVNEVSGPAFKKRKGQYVENSDFGSESVSVNSVGRWLEDVGFGRYADMFELHEVDAEALPLLTLDDLKEMGVLAVGPRRKLYAAINRLRGD